MAAPESPASEPDAILTSDEVSFENPVPGSNDQRMVGRFDEGLEPMESTHVRVALTLNDKPCVDALAAVTAEVEVGESDATSTVTRGGTVTVTVLVRLKDPRWATAAREIIALPITIASSERRNLTILQSLQVP